ncbi:MAG: hypothetical protein ABL973_04950 [Micropepsaceae bacterium]
MSDRKRFLIGVGCGYALILSLLAVRAASDSETTLYVCYGVIVIFSGFLALLLIRNRRMSSVEKAAMRLKSAVNTLSRSFWLEWVAAMPSMLATSLMPSLLREKWHSERFLVGALIGAGIALLLAGWNREKARDYLAKHQPEK